MQLVAVNGFAGHQPRRNAADTCIKYVPKYKVAVFVFMGISYLQAKEFLEKHMAYVLDSNSYSTGSLQVTYSCLEGEELLFEIQRENRNLGN